MHEMPHSSIVPPLPSIESLGTDLLQINFVQQVTTLCIPFACISAYALSAYTHHWVLAVLCLVYLSFVTYGSISHDLVHRTLGLPRGVNDFFLVSIELLAFRSGHAYRLAHLHHHARFPHEDDIEGAAAKMSLPRTLFEGILFQPQMMIWAIVRAHRTRWLVVVETLLVAVWLAGCVASIRFTSIGFVYAALMIMGSWIIPLVTSYIPHVPAAESPLLQTKLFRGRVASIIAMEHLYHLEHHLYPMVPHHNWRALAVRLDPYFARAGIVPVVLGF